MSEKPMIIPIRAHIYGHQLHEEVILSTRQQVGKTVEESLGDASLKHLGIRLTVNERIDQESGTGFTFTTDQTCDDIKSLLVADRNISCE